MPLNEEPDPRQESVPPATRRAAFAALVAAQDAGATVAASRDEVAKEYGLTPEQVRAIEREGMERQWPPLGDAEG